MLVKLKTLSAGLLLAFSASLCVAAEQVPSKSVTGKDWLLMTREEKGTYIFTAMEVLKKNDVPLTQSPDHYTSLIDAELADNANALDSDVTNILATVVFHAEPESQSAIDAIRQKPEIKKIEMH